MGDHDKIAERQGNAVNALTALDHGRFREFLPSFTEEPSFDEPPAVLLVHAECALYLDRLATADGLLSAIRVEEPIDRGRVDVIRAELEFYRDKPDEAGKLCEQAILDLVLVEDSFHLELRARLLRARSILRQGRTDDAVPQLREVARMARATANSYLEALATYCLAVAALRADRDLEAIELLTRISAEFARIGADRWVGEAQSQISLALSNLGRYAEAAEAANSAARTAFELGIWRNALGAEQNGARALVLAGEVEAAASRLRNLIDDERFNQTGYVEIASLYLLAWCHVLARESDEARSVGREVERLAGIVESEVTPREGELVQHWASATSDPRTWEPVAALAANAPAPVALDAVVLLADRAVDVRPALAAYLLTWASRHELLAGRPLTRMLTSRIAERLDAADIRITAYGELALPRPDTHVNFDLAIQATEEHLLLSSYAAAYANQTEAGHKISITKSRFNNMWKGLFEGAPRLRELVEAVARPGGLGNEHIKQGDKQPRRRRNVKRNAADLATAAVAPLSAAAERGRNEGRQAKAEGKRKGRKARNTGEASHVE
jgi:tetratricopeptide (TPR) repeat protein